MTELWPWLWTVVAVVVYIVVYYDGELILLSINAAE